MCHLKKQISLICTKDKSKMCESCSVNHIQSTGHSHYIMNYTDWFRQQNQSKSLKLSCEHSINKKISSAIKDLLETHSSVEILLESRRDIIKSLINRLAEDQIKKVTTNRDFAKYSFEKNFHTLYSKNPSASGLTHLITNLTTESEVDSIIFSEIVKPENFSELETHLNSNLSITHKIYQEGKPIMIPHLRPNSSTANFYDIIHDKVVTKSYESQIFPVCSAWCFIDNFNLAFSGGSLNGNILFEAFTINPGHFGKENLPPLGIERYSHGMIWVKGVLYVFGGVSTENFEISIEKLEIGADHWQVCGRLYENKVKMTLCAVGDKIYIGDENTIEVFDTIDGTCKVLSQFKKADYFIMVGFMDCIFMLKRNSLFCVKPEPNFVTKDLGKIQILEYSNLGQAFVLFGKIFFILDFNKTVYSLNLVNREVKIITSLA